MDRSRLLPVLGIGALLVVDLVLVVWALWPTSPPTATTPGSATAGSSAGTTPSPGATPSPSPSPSAATTPKPLTRLLAAPGTQTVWAADAGSCESRGRVHVSRDGGKTWSTSTAPGSVTRLRPSDASNGFIVGGGEECELRLWRTANGGERWGAAQSAAAAWGRSAEDDRRVHRPSAAPVTPCPKQEPVLDLAVWGEYSAAVLCGEGALRATADGGRSWRTTLERPGAVAIAISGTGQGVVAEVDAGCDGVLVTRLSGDELREGQCVKGVTPEAGEVAISVSSGNVWLVAGDAVLRASAPDSEFTRLSDWPEG